MEQHEEKRPYESQLAHQKRQREIVKDARAMHDRFFEEITVTPYKLAGRRALYFEWSLSTPQWELVEEVADRHGMTGDEFLKRVAQMAMTGRRQRINRN